MVVSLEFSLNSKQSEIGSTYWDLCLKRVKADQIKDKR